VVKSADIWIGTLDNPAFGGSADSEARAVAETLVGYEPLPVLARTIHEREGPSGPNKVGDWVVMRAPKLNTGLFVSLSGVCARAVSARAGRLPFHIRSKPTHRIALNRQAYIQAAVRALDEPILTSS